VKVDYSYNKDVTIMSKRELIDYICEINRSAKTDFLTAFSEKDLNEYLEHLLTVDMEEMAMCS
jgi:hypothetical protein